MSDKTTRSFFESSVSAMKVERATFLSHWKAISLSMSPRRGRFLVSDVNRGGSRYQKIINSRATQAHKIARAGMMSGLMSPASPWFALAAPDPETAEVPEVKIWINQIQLLMRDIFNGSNLGIMSPKLIGELLLFATGAMFDEDDFNDISRFYTHTAGSYMIAQNDKYEVDTFAREFQATTSQLVSWFGLDNVSVSVKDAYRLGNYHSWFPAVHYVDANPEHNVNSRRSESKAFRSVYFEPSGPDKTKFLSQKGYDEFPVYVPRWDTTDGDIYGTDCPAMTALGDVRGLQIQEKRKAQGIDKMVSPPLKGPPSLKETAVENVPGGFTPSEGGATGQEKLESIYNVRLPIGEMRQDIDAVEQRINEAFMVDMFLAISTMRGVQPKNELELSQRDQERLLQVGPVLQGFHKDFLRKLIDRTFNKMVRAKIIPDPPKELQGKELKVEYISTLAMAQRAIATTGIERLGAYVMNLAQSFPDVLDKFDADQSVDEYANVIAIPPRIVVSDSQVKAKRQARQRQQQMQQAAALAEQAAGAAKDASQVDLEGDNLVSRGINNLQEAAGQ